MMNLIKRIISQERRKMEDEIKELSRSYEFTLSDVTRIKLIRLHEDYKMKFRKEYKG